MGVVTTMPQECGPGLCGC